MPVGPPPGSGNIPYTNSAGAHGTIKFGNAITAWSTPASGAPPAMTGGIAELINDSDSCLQTSWGDGTDPVIVEPGGRPFLPIPYGTTQLNWVVVYQNPFQTHPAQTLSLNLFSPSDLANGYPGFRNGAINPSTPAAAIGPGALPAGVLISPSQVTSGLFNFGTNEPASNVIAGVMNNGIILDPLLADGSNPANCNLQSDGTNGNLSKIGGQATQGRGVPLQEAAALDKLITATTLTTICTYTPVAGGQFRVSADFTITAGGTITIQVSFTNRSGVATTLFLTTGITILNTVALAAGTYACHTDAITATTASAVTLSFRDAVLAGADHASGYIEWLQ